MDKHTNQETVKWRGKETAGGCETGKTVFYRPPGWWRTGLRCVNIPDKASRSAIFQRHSGKLLHNAKPNMVYQNYGDINFAGIFCDFDTPSGNLSYKLLARAAIAVDYDIETFLRRVIPPSRKVIISHDLGLRPIGLNISDSGRT